MIIIKLNNFYVSESATFMKEKIPNNFVDLTITSPPYDDLRKYNGYIFDYKSIINELFRVTKDGGIVVWVVGDKTVDYDETGTSFKHALYFKEVGFKLNDTMIYEKTGVSFPQNNARYLQAVEYMFVFSKGNPKTINLIRDRRNVSAGSKITGKQRLDDGTFTTDNSGGRLGKTRNEFGIRYNIWKIKNGHFQTKDKIAFKHPAQFPEQLALDHILSWSNEGDVVFDPMCGSGTVPKMAFINNRNFIGVDMSDEYINTICIPRLTEYGWNKNNMDIVN